MVRETSRAAEGQEKITSVSYKGHAHDWTSLSVTINIVYFISD